MRLCPCVCVCARVFVFPVHTYRGHGTITRKANGLTISLSHKTFERLAASRDRIDDTGEGFLGLGVLLAPDADPLTALRSLLGETLRQPATCRQRPRGSAVHFRTNRIEPPAQKLTYILPTKPAIVGLLFADRVCRSCCGLCVVLPANVRRQRCCYGVR